jgi:hypothetical protein
MLELVVNYLGSKGLAIELAKFSKKKFLKER